MANVAELAGVSLMTVSRVINGTGPVSAKTRDRVLSAMTKLDYQPNPAARALASGRTRQFGVLAHRSMLFGPASTLHAIEHTARQSGYTVAVVTVEDFNSTTIRSALDDLLRRGADGLVVMTPHQSAVSSIAGMSFELPVVTTHGQVHGLPSVTVDQSAGARRAAELLLSLGHRRLAHIAGPQDWLEASARARTWRTVLDAAGIDDAPLVEGDWTARSGYELARRLLATNDVTAIFAANDQMALGVYRAALEAGRRVPSDLSIVGFDDVPEAAYYPPPLTTVRQDFAEVGRSSIDLLLDALDEPADEAKHRTVDAEVVLRDSAAAPRS